MTKAEIIELMEKRGFTLNMTSKDGDGKETCHFLSEPVYKTDGETYLIPPVGCAVYLETGEFQLMYAVPKGINRLETPKCSALDNDKHFDNICGKFENAVQVLYAAFGEE